MGIKALNAFLKARCPDAFKDLPYSYFKGKRVAVDSDNVLRKLMSRAHKDVVNRTDVCVNEPDRKEITDQWLYHIQNEVTKFLKFGITLIWVFDGSYIDEKSDTQAKRREEKQKREKEAEDMKKKVRDLDPLEITSDMVTDLRKKMHHLGNIKSEDKNLICNIFRQLGFPVMFATEEGEKLCAMLCIEGYVDAVYSTDTDLIALGCPLTFGKEAGWIINPDTKKSEMAVKCTIFHPILQSLKMEYETFLDLCIMSGCDFNSNIYRLGCKKAYDLLLECKKIENLPEKLNDKIGILNHIRCREIFKRENAKTICQGEIILNNNKNMNIVDLELFRKWNLENWLNEVKNLYEDFIDPSNLFIEKPPSYRNSIVKLKILKNYQEENKDKEEYTKIEIPKIPKQIASPKRVTQKIINSINDKQVERLKEKLAREENKVKLKILSK